MSSPTPINHAYAILHSTHQSKPNSLHIFNTVSEPLVLAVTTSPELAQRVLEKHQKEAMSWENTADYVFAMYRRRNNGEDVLVTLKGENGIREVRLSIQMVEVVCEEGTGLKLDRDSMGEDGEAEQQGNVEDRTYSEGQGVQKRVRSMSLDDTQMRRSAGMAW